VRQGGVVSYLHADHLGSASLATTSGGAVHSQQRYLPYGAERWHTGTLPTDYRFTGQRSEEATLGSLYDYGARFYSPVLGRFLSADTIVPSPGNPQSLNRYSYVSIITTSCAIEQSRHRAYSNHKDRSRHRA
jgi:RHS repeat-associated protein